ncbi:glutathione S-transferase T3-like [Asparagus officinalis]|uniref:glutathione S-transferase T3-like n=1 Tax=Asparagus officinalis TaxID=4686 RepID=UPI00098E5886|nr:glutathione S-transferase T3-like [Asparagus officinalis]
MAENNNPYYVNLMTSHYPWEDQYEEQSFQPDILEENSVKDVPLQKKLMRKSKYRIEEVILLVSAWINTSIDPMQGTLQKYATFWNQEATYYHENKTFSSDRDQKGLEHRWSAIQIAVSKFCGCFNQIKARNQSGLTENDKVPSKVAWPIFNEKAKKSKNSSPATSSPATPDSINCSEEECLTEGLSRPIGRKDTKERLKQGKDKHIASEITPAMLFIDEMKQDRKEKETKRTKLFDQIYVQEQERIKIEQARLQFAQEAQNIKKEKMRLKAMKQDERITVINTDGMPPLQVEYYNKLKMEILERQFGGGGSN